MQTNNTFFNDFAKMMTGIMGNAQGVSTELMAQMQQCFATYTLNAGFVKNQELAVLEQRIVLLEDKIHMLENKLSPTDLQENS